MCRQYGWGTEIGRNPSLWSNLWYLFLFLAVPTFLKTAVIEEVSPTPKLVPHNHPSHFL